MLLVPVAARRYSTWVSVQTYLANYSWPFPVAGPCRPYLAPIAVAALLLTAVRRYGALSRRPCGVRLGQQWKVVSDDGQEFLVPEGVIKMSEPLKTQWDEVGELSTQLISSRCCMWLPRLTVQPHSRRGACSTVDDDDPEPLRVSAKGDTLAKVFEWARKHVTPDGKEPLKLAVEQPLKDGSYAENGISEEDAAWVDGLSLEDAFLDVVNLANTLAMQELLSLLCMRVAFWFKGKTPREIQEYFGIEDPNVLSPEEITAQCDQHKWAEKLTVGGAAEDDGSGGGGAAGAAGGAGGEGKADT